MLETQSVYRLLALLTFFLLQCQFSKSSFQFGRFVKTLNYFSQLNPFSRVVDRFMPKGIVKQIPPGDVIWTPSSNAFELEFGILDDVVMGGASESKIASGKDFTGKWEGIVTTANNGGFAGIRTKTLSPGLGKT